jgi:hypothetical protein
VGSETPRGFNHGPAMGPVVSTTNEFAFISACGERVHMPLTRAVIPALSAYVPGTG